MTKNMQDIVKQVKKLGEMVNESVGIFNIDVASKIFEGPSVHMDSDEFFELLAGEDIERKAHSASYKYRYYVIADGIEIFCLSNEERDNDISKVN